MKILLAIAAAVLLTGCAATLPPDFPEGEMVPAPWGYTDLCNREPESVFCE